MKKLRLRHGSLFSGIGGFDLAAEWMGWQNMFHCEVDPFCQKVLNYYFPNAQRYGDIRKTDFSKYRGQIDVLTGGFPCQPFSIAGKRLGKEDKRHLWPYMLSAIQQIRPRWIVGENVRGIISWNEGMVFEEVQIDLEAQGYHVQPYVLPAAGLGAPHRRERVWFIAYTGSDGYGQYRPGEDRCTQGENKSSGDQWQRFRPEPGRTVPTAPAPNASGFRCNNRGDNRPERHLQDNQRPTPEIQPEWEIGKCGPGPADRDASNTTGEGLERETGKRVQHGPGQTNRNIIKEPAGHGRTERWERFPETQPAIRIGNDGLPDPLDFNAIFESIPLPVKPITFSRWRMESIKALGNAIVPQVAYQLFKIIQKMNDQYQSQL